MREALWFIWEHPRLPPPLVSSKYPTSYPWSPGAQAVRANGDGKRPKGGWGLVIEHLYPHEFVIVDLLEGEIGDRSAAVELLTKRTMAAVVTRDEDRLLPMRGKSTDTWASYDADPWLRYRSSGIAIEAFAPVGVSAPLS